MRKRYEDGKLRQVVKYAVSRGWHVIRSTRHGVILERDGKRQMVSQSALRYGSREVRRFFE